MKMKCQHWLWSINDCEDFDIFIGYKWISFCFPTIVSVILFRWSPAIIFITVFSTIFATVIAITKDLPDVKGDIQYNINTFATRLGVEKVSAIGILLLFANYIGAIMMGLLLNKNYSLYNTNNNNHVVMIMSHVLLAGSILNQWRIVNLVRMIRFIMSMKIHVNFCRLLCYW